jgi:hypothetical protein
MSTPTRGCMSGPSRPQRRAARLSARARTARGAERGWRSAAAAGSARTGRERLQPAHPDVLANPFAADLFAAYSGNVDPTSDYTTAKTSIERIPRSFRRRRRRLGSRAAAAFLSDSSLAFRQALQGLDQPREIPTHAWRAALYD